MFPHVFIILSLVAAVVIVFVKQELSNHHPIFFQLASQTVSDDN